MVSALKSDEIFDLITKYLATGEAVDTVKKIAAVYQIDILQKKGGKVVKSWSIDMKNDKGACKESKADSPDATFTLTDDDFHALCHGKLNAQMAVVQGKMKIKGNMKKATAFTPDLFPKPTPENIQKYTKAKF